MPLQMSPYIYVFVSYRGRHVEQSSETVTAEPLHDVQAPRPRVAL